MAGWTCKDMWEQVWDGRLRAHEFFDDNGKILSAVPEADTLQSVMARDNHATETLYIDNYDGTITNGASSVYTNKVSTMGDNAGVLFGAYIMDAGISEGWFVIDKIDYLGDWKAHLMAINLNANTTRFYTSLSVDGTIAASNLSGTNTGNQDLSPYALISNLGYKLDTASAAVTYATISNLGLKLTTSSAALLYETKANVGLKLTTSSAALTYATIANVQASAALYVPYINAANNVLLGARGISASAASFASVIVNGNVASLGDVTNGYVLTFNSTTGVWEGASAGAGSQTPWTSNIDGAGYTLSNATIYTSGAITSTSGAITAGVGGFTTAYNTFLGGDTYLDTTNVNTGLPSGYLYIDWTDGSPITNIIGISSTYTRRGGGSVPHGISFTRANVEFAYMQYTTGGAWEHWFDGSLDVENTISATTFTGALSGCTGNISQFTNDSSYLTDLSAFTTDDLAEGSTNKYASGYTGDLNDSNNNKIADVVNGLITTTYY